jgi:hypothetical protein
MTVLFRTLRACLAIYKSTSIHLVWDGRSQTIWIGMDLCAAKYMCFGLWHG